MPTVVHPPSPPAARTDAVRFRWLGHGAGALLCALVLALAGPIASASTSGISWLFRLFAGDEGPHFFVMQGAEHGTAWVLVPGTALVGAFVAAFDALVRRGLVRAWVPPLAVLALAIASIASQVVHTQGDGTAAAAIGLSLGVVPALAFAGWWYAAPLVARMRAARMGSPTV